MQPGSKAGLPTDSHDLAPARDQAEQSIGQAVLAGVRHAGGGLLELGHAAGDGRLFPNKSSFIRGFTLADEEKWALIAFLKSLTDERLLERDDLGQPTELP